MDRGESGVRGDISQPIRERLIVKEQQRERDRKRRKKEKKEERERERE